MRKLVVTSLALAALQVSGIAWAKWDGNSCSVKRLAGNWAFATDVGHERLMFGADITAIGIFTVDRRGRVEGVFDVTVDDGMTAHSDVPFEGELTMNDDCRGRLTFVTGSGSRRTDSIVMLNRHALWGMSKDPLNLWTYQVRRLPGRR